MGDVIHVNFAERRRFASAKEALVDLVARHLDENDFQDFIEAVNDTTGKLYIDMDREMQIIVEAFFQQQD